ncbi:hypothetical protein [uncultured Sanguibacteroides sp.]|uniref:hypothetical protein n=1 Tax=uncultured Sanguibacteroides sp. TaxID=1635151 RepID=UPI0025CEF153|nr:hypothetical protein [uncultured Sanguibacteroides sp.]
MKKTIQLVVLALVFLVGGISTGMAQINPIKRTQFCYEGENWVVSFMGVEFDSGKEIYIRKHIVADLYEGLGIGTDIGMYCYVGVTLEESGVYEFGHWRSTVSFDTRLIVTLVVVPKPDASIAARMGKPDDLKGINHGLLFSRLVCIQEKSLVWQSHALVLA